MTYRTKQELETIVKMQKRTITKLEKQCNAFKQEIFALRNKAIVNPLYNRPIDLKERVNREAEVEYRDEDVRKIMAKRSQELVDAYDEVARKDKQPFSIIKWLSQFRP